MEDIKRIFTLASEFKYLAAVERGDKKLGFGYIFEMCMRLAHEDNIKELLPTIEAVVMDDDDTAKALSMFRREVLGNHYMSDRVDTVSKLDGLRNQNKHQSIQISELERVAENTKNGYDKVLASYRNRISELEAENEQLKKENEEIRKDITAYNELCTMLMSNDDNKQATNSESTSTPSAQSVPSTDYVRQ